MAQYELMLIIDPTVTDADRAETMTNLKALFEKNSIKIEKEDVWWDKKMAYKINSSDRGFYVLFNLELDGTVLKTVTNAMNLEKNLWRHMFVKKGA